MQEDNTIVNWRIFMNDVLNQLQEVKIVFPLLLAISEKSIDLLDKSALIACNESPLG